MMGTSEVNMLEDKIRNIGGGNVDSVPIGVTEMEASTNSSTSTAEEQPEKKRPIHKIKGEIKTKPMMSCPYYWTRDCGGRSRQRQHLEFAMEMDKGWY